MITCWHVIADATRVQVVFNSGRPGEVTLPAEVLGGSAEMDLAGLRVVNPPAGAEPLVLAQKTEVRETETVFAAGFPFGERLALDSKNPEIAVTKASVASLRTDNAGNLVAVQFAGELHPGNSGGPVVDSAGRVIGVAQSKILGTGTAFAVPTEQLRIFLRGGLKSLIFRQEPVSPTETRLHLTASLINLQGSIQAVGVLWIPSSRVSNIVPPAGARLAPGMTDVPLKLEGARAEGSFVLRRLPSEPDALELVLQPYLRWSDGSLQYLLPTRGKVIFESPVAPPPAEDVAKPAVPRKRMEPLESTLARDSEGQSFVEAVTTPQKVKLGNNLLHVAVPPSGAAVYAIFRDQPGIKVFDPETWAPVKDILTPRSPTSIWCDDKRIVVTCPESKVITFIDPAAGKPIKSVPMNDPNGPPDLLPVGVTGRAADGSFLTLWRAAGASRWDTWLYQVTEAGRFRRIGREDVEYACPLNSRFLLLQRNFGGSPSGLCLLWDVASEKSIILQPNTLFKEGWHRDFGHVFLTHDRRHVVLPTRPIGSAYGYATRTYLADLELRQIASEIPGLAFAEVPSEGLLISMGLRYVERTEAGPEIYYSSRSTSRLVRRIRIRNFKPHPAEFIYRSAVRDLFFLPGHEVVLIKPRTEQDGIIYAIRCGPVATAGPGSDPAVRFTNDPPSKAKVGQEIVFVPSFQKPAGAKGVHFKLKKGPDEIRVDPVTGRMTWKPSDAYVGRFDIAIVAIVDGAEVPVLEWTIEVGF